MVFRCQDSTNSCPKGHHPYAKELIQTLLTGGAELFLRAAYALDLLGDLQATRFGFPTASCRPRTLVRASIYSLLLPAWGMKPLPPLAVRSEFHLRFQAWSVLNDLGLDKKCIEMPISPVLYKWAFDVS